MDWTAVCNCFKNNWCTLMSAPLVFVLCIGISALTGYLIAKWYFRGNIENLKGKIGQMEQRVLGKDDLLDEYRQRLNMIPPDQTGSVFSKMTHAELQKEAISLVEGIHQLCEGHKKIEDKLRIESSQKEREAKSEEERQQILQKHNQEEHQRFLKSLARYNSEFKVNAILIRDEILSSLPKEERNKKAFFYEHPGNLLGVNGIADNLERLAKTLELEKKGPDKKRP